MRKPPTGEPCAGEPHARFGGRGGETLSDPYQHLPKSLYRRRATSKPDGRRQDYWVYMRQAELHQLGDVTIVLSKKRRNLGPNRVKIIVTNLLDVSADAVITQYSIRWCCRYAPICYWFTPMDVIQL